MDEQEKRVDLNSELGMSRRDLLRRGAIVGGTLLWVAPAIQSIGARAAWANGASPGACGVCYCVRLRADGSIRRDECNKDGVTGIYASQEACEAHCASGGTAGRTYDAALSEWCQGVDCNCGSQSAGNPPPFGADCS